MRFMCRKKCVPPVDSVSQRNSGPTTGLKTNKKPEISNFFRVLIKGRLRLDYYT